MSFQLNEGCKKYHQQELNLRLTDRNRVSFHLNDGGMVGAAGVEPATSCL